MDADEFIRKRYNVNLLSSESRILLHVAYNRCANIKQAHGHSMLSSRAFYTKVKKLTEQGYLQVNMNTDDRRKRSLLLTDQGVTLVDSLKSLLLGRAA